MSEGGSKLSHFLFPSFEFSQVPTCLWDSDSFCAWPVQCSEGTEYWCWMKRLPMWILAQMRSSRSRSGRSSGTAQFSPLPTASTPLWTVIVSLSYLMARWLSLVAHTSCFAKGETFFEKTSFMIFFSDGVLAELAAQTGEASKERLLEIARTAYFRYYMWLWCPAWLSILTATSMELCQKRTVGQNFEEKVVPSHNISSHLPVIMNMSVHCRELYFWNCIRFYNDCTNASDGQ